MIEQSNDTKEKKTAVLFSVQTHGVSNEENDSSLLELRRLVKTMGLKVVATLTQRRSKPDARTLLGAGKLKELAGYTGGTGIVEGFSRKSDDETSEDLNEDYPADYLDDYDPMAKDSVQANVVIYDGEISTKGLGNINIHTYSFLSIIIVDNVKLMGYGQHGNLQNDKGKPCLTIQYTIYHHLQRI